MCQGVTDGHTDGRLYDSLGLRRAIALGLRVVARNTAANQRRRGLKKLEGARIANFSTGRCKFLTEKIQISFKFVPQFRVSFPNFNMFENKLSVKKVFRQVIFWGGRLSF